jgi:competence protein ComEC
LTGAAPSAVRAFWMVTCLHGAHQLRVPTNSLATLAASALGVLVFYPHQLFSASFQMSYGIVAALLLYGVPLQEKWHAAWQPWANLPRTEREGWRTWVEKSVRFVLGLIALGLAATLVSTPATLGFFGLLSPGGFLLNLALIPASSLVLFAGVGSMIAGGLGLAPLADIFNHAAALVLTLMDAAVVAALKVPGASWPAHYTAPWLAPVVGAGMLGLLAVGYALGWRRRFGGYWSPYAALALVLLLCVRSAPTPPPPAAQAAAEEETGVMAAVSAAFSTTWSTRP